MSTSSGSACETAASFGAMTGCVSMSSQKQTSERREDVPLCNPPPSPVILFNLDAPPALILASRRSLRIRACSEALGEGVLPEGADTGDASVILRINLLNK